MDKKPWYQSKIILLAGSLALVFGSNLLGASLFRSGVTPEQIDAISSTYPQTVDIFNRIQAGENFTNLIGMAFSVLIGIARAWFTKIPAISAGK